MARTVQVHLVDDIDGGRAEETVRFALDGASFEIDLSAKHAARMRSVLAKYVAAARRQGRERGAAAARRQVPAAGRATRVHSQAIRDWARANGVELSGRGRIPRSVVERYEAQAGGQHR